MSATVGITRTVKPGGVVQHDRRTWWNRILEKYVGQRVMLRQAESFKYMNIYDIGTERAICAAEDITDF